MQRWLNWASVPAAAVLIVSAVLCLRDKRAGT
jgi:hypothetical protein